MAEQLGRGLYRGLLRDRARVWNPREIQDISLLQKAYWSTCGPPSVDFDIEIGVGVAKHKAVEAVLPAGVVWGPTLP